MKHLIRLVILMVLPLTSMALVPSYINYQGRLLESGIPVGYPTPVTATMKITIWSASSAGTKLYEETHSSVNVDDGVYSFQIGSGVPTAGFSWNPASLFSASATRYTELTITIAPNPPETLSPRQQLLSAPYTVHSGNSENLGNQPPGYYGTAATDSNLQGQISTLSDSLRTICENGNGIWDGSTCAKTIPVLIDSGKPIPISQLLKRWTESEMEMECAEPHYHAYPDPSKGGIIPVKNCNGDSITQEPDSRGCAFGKESAVVYYELSKCDAFIVPK